MIPVRLKPLVTSPLVGFNEREHVGVSRTPRESHPSQFVRFPSSHCSLPSTIPFPIVGDGSTTVPVVAHVLDIDHEY